MTQALPFMAAGPRGFPEFLRRLYVAFFPESGFEQSREIVSGAIERARAKHSDFDQILRGIDRAALEIEPQWPESSLDEYLAELVAIARARAAQPLCRPSHRRRAS